MWQKRNYLSTVLLARGYLLPYLDVLRELNHQLVDNNVSSM